MINHNFVINYLSEFNEGGYCQVYPIKHKKRLVFKEFKNKKKAQEAYKYQKLLSKFDLAPQLYSDICKLEFDSSIIDPTAWGFVTESATIYDPATKISMRDIQILVDNINNKTGLKFWDCHWYNIGMVKRGNTNKVVCIDTGKESFDGYANAWGFAEPGPKCCYCEKYQCKCSS